MWLDSIWASHIHTGRSYYNKRSEPLCVPVNKANKYSISKLNIYDFHFRFIFSLALTLTHPAQPTVWCTCRVAIIFTGCQPNQFDSLWIWILHLLHSVALRQIEWDRAVCLALFLLFRVCTDRLLLFVVCFTWIYHLTYFWYAVPQFASAFFARHYSYCVFCRYCQSSLFILFHRPLFIWFFHLTTTAKRG